MKIFSFALLATLLFPAAAWPIEAKVSVDATALGALIPDELFGQNWNTYEKSGDGKDEAYNRALKAMGAGLLRIPGGGYASMRTWDDITCGGKDASWLVDLRGAINFAEKSGVKLLPIVNFGGHWCDKDHGYDAAIAKAAEWVKYMNVTPKAHPSVYWEIGNEIYYERDKAHTDGATYGKQFARFAKAMKVVDPTIKLGFNLFENRDPKKLPWNLAALKALKASGASADFFAVHSYPIWLPAEARTASGAPNWNKNWYADHPAMDADIIKNINTVAQYTQELDQTIAEVLGKGRAGKIPYHMTEFRSVLELKYVEFVDALYSAQVLLEMGRLGWKGSNIWALKNGFSAKHQADFGLLRTGVNPKFEDDMPKNSPRPSYYVYPYLSKVFGRQMVGCRAEGEGVRAWASKDSQGNLTLFVANNAPDEKDKAKIQFNIQGFTPGPQGLQWLMESDGTRVSGGTKPIQQRRDIKINGVRRPSIESLPGQGKAVSGGPSFSLELPASSMALIKLSPKGAAR